MSEKVVISVKGISKAYKAGNSQIAKVINALWPTYTRGTEDLWALKDVSFDVKAGESVAIIGRNGGGKSTLLEIITGTRMPTDGQVEVKGQVAALLQLGSGFNPEFSGRENVYLNGLLLGLTREEIEDRFDEIIDFADIGDVLDRPVKTYSSGMLVRLAFSVQIALEPDILIVDEALSVGDFFFQQKCAIRMQELRDKGTTVLFVSHSMEAVKKVCDRAIVLVNGKLIFDGKKDKAIQLYLTGSETAKASLVETPPKNTRSQNTDGLWDKIKEQEEIMMWKNDSFHREGLLAACIRDEYGEEPLTVLVGDKRILRLYFIPPTGVSSLISFEIKDKYGKSVYSTTSVGLGLVPFIGNKNIINFDIEISLLLRHGEYSFQFNLNAIDTNNRANVGERLDKTPALGPFIMYFDSYNPLPFRSDIGLLAEASFNNNFIGN